MGRKVEHYGKLSDGRWCVVVTNAARTRVVTIIAEEKEP